MEDKFRLTLEYRTNQKFALIQINIKNITFKERNRLLPN